MKNKMTPRLLDICPWDMDTGPLNLISDVPGITVGHTTLSCKDVQTGVTALMPHQGNMFREKLPAAMHVINGFGKSMGQIQINEMGTIETPIILTNTLSIGTAATALIEYMLENNTDIGDSTGTVNPVICECNDGFLNDIRGMHVQKSHVRQAMESASRHFDQGAVGAGTGMCAYELKGGIGSASRLVRLAGNSYTVGALVLTNMGKIRDLTIAGTRVGLDIAKNIAGFKEPVPDGSIIMIIATDIPLCERQLGRIAKRALNGLSLTGSKIDSGSGEIVLAFSTASKIDHYPEKNNPFVSRERLHEDLIDTVFRAVAESTEEAVLNAMFMADTTTGVHGRRVFSLTDCLDENLMTRIIKRMF